jgi:hypothetical protein
MAVWWSASHRIHLPSQVTDFRVMWASRKHDCRLKHTSFGCTLWPIFVTWDGCTRCKMVEGDYYERKYKFSTYFKCICSSCINLRSLLFDHNYKMI